MLRDYLDVALQEDFVRGLGRTSGLRAATYDAQGGLIACGPPISGFSRLTGRVLAQIPPNPTLVPVPAHDPPGHVTFVEDRGVWYVAAPVYIGRRLAGWVAVGEFRAEAPAEEPPPVLPGTSNPPEVVELWKRLPPLDRGGEAHAVVTARWGARMLAQWCRQEARVISATEQAALVGDIAEWITAGTDLSSILDHIVAETARVMKCDRCGLRLYDPETNELRIRAGYNLSREYLDKGPIILTENSIDAAALRGEIVYVADAASDPRVQYPDKMRREGIVSLLTAGMFYHGRPIGVIRVYTNRPRRFRRSQQDLLRAVAHQAAMAIVHARLVEERLKSAETERQLALASELQARMMRVPPPRHPRLATAREYVPSSHLGGDFCDIFSLADGRLVAAVADVVGKGIPASLLSASIRGALCAGAEHCHGLGELLTRLNRQVCAETQPGEFVTLLLVAIDPEHGFLGHCSAGHEPLLLLRDGRVLSFEGEGPVLGVWPEARYEERVLDLQPGDTLLLYTDGLVEAMNFKGELFGRERLAAALRQYGELTIDQVLHNLLWDVRRFVGLAEQSDDLTMVGVRVLRETPTPLEP